jgi:hypothetical protein
MARLIARDGSPAPGAAPGVVFGSIYENDRIVTNSRGQIVMQMSVDGPGVSLANDSGIWYDTGDGQLRLAMREGETYIDDGTPRTPRTMDFFGGGPARGLSSFNDRGQFVTFVTFNNGSGVYVLQVPEPAAATIALLCPVLLLLRRRARRD